MVSATTLTETSHVSHTRMSLDTLVLVNATARRDSDYYVWTLLGPRLASSVLPMLSVFRLRLLHVRLLDSQDAPGTGHGSDVTVSCRKTAEQGAAMCFVGWPRGCMRAQATLTGERLGVRIAAAVPAAYHILTAVYSSTHQVK